ncbi:MAG: hypothetical protein QM572_18110 [Nocardioides sp.]|uniref:hypothetical protein n=1 Tax=Nocardioides sp. TaxID=35761 RepID=UPI0039E31A4F
MTTAPDTDVATEEAMLGAIRAIPETIGNWRDNRDLLYQIVTGISAALVVTTLVGGKRPVRLPRCGRS